MGFRFDASVMSDEDDSMSFMFFMSTFLFVCTAFVWLMLVSMEL